jgi:hypothetical protein
VSLCGKKLSTDQLTAKREVVKGWSYLIWLHFESKTELLIRIQKCEVGGIFWVKELRSSEMKAAKKDRIIPP